MNLPPGTEELFPSVGKILPSEEVLFGGLRKTAASFLPIPVVVRVAGGWVRDKVLGRTSEDVDIVIDTVPFDDFASRLKNMFPKDKQHELPIDQPEKKRKTSLEVSKIGKNVDAGKHLELATVHVLGYDLDVLNLRTLGKLSSFTRFRDDGVEQIDLGGERVVVSLSSDAAQLDAFLRDFSINSLFYNICSQKVEDWTGRGLSDLKDQLVCCPCHPGDREGVAGALFRFCLPPSKDVQRMETLIEREERFAGIDSSENSFLCIECKSVLKKEEKVLKKEEFFEPENQQNEEKILGALGRLSEDPSRILRAVRFAGRFSCQISWEIQHVALSCSPIRDVLKYKTKRSRILKEFDKMILSSNPCDAWAKMILMDLPILMLRTMNDPKALSSFDTAEKETEDVKMEDGEERKDTPLQLRKHNEFLSFCQNCGVKTKLSQRKGGEESSSYFSSTSNSGESSSDVLLRKIRNDLLGYDGWTLHKYVLSMFCLNHIVDFVKKTDPSVVKEWERVLEGDISTIYKSTIILPLLWFRTPSYLSSSLSSTSPKRQKKVLTRAYLKDEWLWTKREAGICIDLIEWAEELHSLAHGTHPFLSAPLPTHFFSPLEQKGTSQQQLILGTILVKAGPLWNIALEMARSIDLFYSHSLGTFYDQMQELRYVAFQMNLVSDILDVWTGFLVKRNPQVEETGEEENERDKGAVLNIFQKKPFFNGSELVKLFNLRAGPQIGEVTRELQKWMILHPTLGPTDAQEWLSEKKGGSKKGKKK